MTEKELIIDGIDISKCECSRQFNLDVNIICISNSPNKKSVYCKDNPNCYFKQLKRKTQDEQSLLNVIDYLQQQKNKFEAYYNDLGQDFDQLKVENKRLEKKLKQIESYCEEQNSKVDYTACGILQIIDEEDNEKNS